MKMIDLGFGSFVAETHVVLIADPDSAPIKRLIREAKSRGRVIDCTYGRRAAAAVLTDSDHIALSAIAPAELNLRIGEIKL